MEMVELQIRPQHMHFNSLMTACAKNADSTTAKGVFDVMPKWDLTPRTEDYNILISCCRMDLKNCVSIFEQMQQSGTRVIGRTYQEMLNAYVCAKDREGAQTFM